MDRCALFVDAGYALADGAMAVHGTRRRDSVSWDHAGFLKLLAGLARDRTGLPVLRCYWYETAGGHRAAEHDALAEMPGLKLRLVNTGPGRDEGIESQIRRDLVTLVKSGAISDAFIASADERLAELVSEVQDLGLRVVVLHIASDSGWTIPRSLRHQCDDIAEISGVHLRPFVDLIRGAEPALPHEQPYGVGSSVTGSDKSLAGTPAGDALSRPALPVQEPPAPVARQPGGQHHAAHTAVNGNGSRRPVPAADVNSGRANNSTANAGAVNGASWNGASWNGASRDSGAGYFGAGQGVAWNAGAADFGAANGAAGDSRSASGAAAYGSAGNGSGSYGSGGYRSAGNGSGGNGSAGNGSAGFSRANGAAAGPAANGLAWADSGWAGDISHAGISSAGAPAAGGLRGPGHSGEVPNGSTRAADSFARALSQGQPANVGRASAHSVNGGRGAADGGDGGRGAADGGDGGPGRADQVRRAEPAYPLEQSPSYQPQQNRHRQPRRPEAALPAVRQAQPVAVPLPEAVTAAHSEGFTFGQSVSREAPGLWLEAVLARKPRMPSDLEARLLQGSVLPVDSLLRDEVRHSLRRGFWDALESTRR